MSLVGVRRERNFSGGCLSKSTSKESLHQLSREMSYEELSKYFSQQQESVLTIEELKEHFHSCFTCGVLWNEDHVSLDCKECGGYSFQRPCPQCDGKCQAVWKRDFSMSHSSGKAQWAGECNLETSSVEPTLLLRSIVDSKTKLCNSKTES